MGQTAVSDIKSSSLTLQPDNGKWCYFAYSNRTVDEKTKHLDLIRKLILTNN